MLTDFGGWLAEHATVVATAVSAIATAFIAVFTLKLTGATAGQLKRLDESIRLARDEFNATHRPELTVREVRWGERNNSIAFTIANRGRICCRIVESAFSLTSGDVAQSVQTNGRNEIGVVTLATGEYRDCAHSFDSEDESSAAAFEAPSANEGLVSAAHREGWLDGCFFSGTIVYEDGSRIRRRLVFKRRSPKGGVAFYSTGNPNDEYTD